MVLAVKRARGDTMGALEDAMRAFEVEDAARNAKR